VAIRDYHYPVCRLDIRQDSEGGKNTITDNTGNPAYLKPTCSKNTITDNTGNPAYLKQF